MSNQRTRMIKKAEKLHKKIYPCAARTHLDECFTNNNDFLCFWYNTEDHSTHVITEAITKPVQKQIRKKVNA